MAGSAKALIIDYGMGNLRSVEKAVEAVGGTPSISPDPDAVRNAERLILPGVGAFGDAMENLRQRGLDRAICEAVREGKPLLGLCLGLQLLFSQSEEFGLHQGLNLIPGKVLRFDEAGLRVPHVGWNILNMKRQHPIFQGIKSGRDFYFVHSYAIVCERETDLLAVTEYGGEVTAVIGRANILGVQFHPEKSQVNGLRLIENCCRWDGRC